MISRFRLRHRVAAVGSAVGLSAVGLVAVAAPSQAFTHGEGCRIDRTLDTATFFCTDTENWYAAVVRCAGYRQVGRGVQQPTYIVGDSIRPFIPLTVECTGQGRQGIVLDYWLDGPF
ncbi:hypothetical protein [Nocardia sp. IFM 10818]